MKIIKDLSDIDTSTPEGMLLLAALAKITTEIYPDKTPGEVVAILGRLEKSMEEQAQRRFNPLVRGARWRNNEIQSFNLISLGREE